MKSEVVLDRSRGPMSPPEWGAWIEMLGEVHERTIHNRRPPSGGRGLKFHEDDATESHLSRPPSGGRGLKFD